MNFNRAMWFLAVILCAIAYVVCYKEFIETGSYLYFFFPIPAFVPIVDGVIRMIKGKW